MPQNKRAKLSTSPPDSPSTPDELGSTAAPSAMETTPPDEKMEPASKKDRANVCCHLRDSWISHGLALDRYTNGPTPDGLMDRGGWESLATNVKLQARGLRQLGLAPWDDLAPETKERLSSWSPVARQLWESDFPGHHEAMVRAWIWHYLDDNVFSFAGGTQGQPLVALSTPVWEHLRAFRRDLHVLLHDPKGFDDHLYRIQFYSFSRMAEHLVRRGLGQPDPIKAADFVPHYKEHLRLIIRDGETKLPNDAHDGDLRWHYGDAQDVAGGPPHHRVRLLVEAALLAQYYIHGTSPGSYTIRFTPIGSDRLFGFPFDKDWMELSSPVEIPDNRPGSEVLPNVELVSDPMLVVSGLDGLSYHKKYECCAPLAVVAPWTFGGEEAVPFVYPGFEKGWDQRNMERIREAMAAAASAADPADNSEVSQTTHDNAADEEQSEDQSEDQTNQEEPGQPTMR